MTIRTDRNAMEYDVEIVGGGPSGLTAAIRIKQLAERAGREDSLGLLENGSGSVPISYPVQCSNGRTLP